jgi:hypothetical protein
MESVAWHDHPVWFMTYDIAGPSVQQTLGRFTLERIKSQSSYIRSDKSEAPNASRALARIVQVSIRRATPLPWAQPTRLALSRVVPKERSD